MKWRGGGHGGEVFHSVLFSSNTFLVVVFFFRISLQPFLARASFGVLPE